MSGLYLVGLGVLTALSGAPEAPPGVAERAQPPETSEVAARESAPTPTKVPFLSYRGPGYIDVRDDGTVFAGADGDVLPEDWVPVEPLRFEFSEPRLTLVQHAGRAFLDVDGALSAALGIAPSDMSSVPLDGTFRSATAPEGSRTSVLELNGELVVELRESGRGYIELTDAAKGTTFAIAFSSAPATHTGSIFWWDCCEADCPLGSCDTCCLMPLRHADCYCTYTGHARCVCRSNFGFSFNVTVAHHAWMPSARQAPNRRTSTR